MGYRNRQRHPIYGDGTATATVEGGPHDWGPFNAYRQLVLAAGATINAPPTNKGALIIRCTERLEIAGKLDAAAKARTGQYNSRGWAAYEHGTMGTIGGHVNGSDYAGGMFSLLPIPGGGGGWGDAGAGDTHAMYLSARKDGGGIYLWTDVFDDYRALGGVNQGDPGEDGDTCITPTVDLADFVKPELGLYAIGCGGAAGGRNGTDNGCALGGDGGGLIVLIAPIVVLRATAEIDVAGADGAAATKNHGGGGGGGGGGCLAVICRDYTDEGATVTLDGGSGGAGFGNGGNGGDGSDGIVVMRKVA